MPAHAEMASPIRPAAARGIRLINELPRHLVIQSAEASGCTVETTGALRADEETRNLPKRPTTAAATAPASRPVNPR
jgi:hypothetical protein